MTNRRSPVRFNFTPSDDIKMKKNLLAFGILLLSGFAATAQQTVTLRTGEKMNGKIESMQNGIISFQFKGNIMKLKVSEVYDINFGEDAPAVSGTVSSSAAPKEPGEKQVTSGSYLVRYKVADRVVAKPPKVDNLTQEKGTVVVDISIDKYGTVKKAVPGAPGTSAGISEYLKTKAMQAAQSAMFNNVPTAPLEQKGYMVIVF